MPKTVTSFLLPEDVAQKLDLIRQYHKKTIKIDLNTTEIILSCINFYYEECIEKYIEEMELGKKEQN